MAKTPLLQFHVRQDRSLGDRLILRYPGASPGCARQLARATGITELPNQITIGYYCRLDDPPEAWAFMPVARPLAIAALDLSVVRDRICEDLAIRLRKDAGDDV